MYVIVFVALIIAFLFIRKLAKVVAISEEDSSNSSNSCKGSCENCDCEEQTY
jgi:hypothetical protein